MHSFERLTLLAALCLLPAGAWATPTFPGVIEQQLGTPSTPDCSLCHVGNAARGTVTTLIGAKLMTRGLVAHDEDSLRTALLALEGSRSDVDGDGVTDIEELKAGTDPNSPEGTEVVIPEYGCGVAGNASAAQGSGAVPLWSALGVVALLWRTRRRRAA